MDRSVDGVGRGALAVSVALALAACAGGGGVRRTASTAPIVPTVPPPPVPRSLTLPAAPTLKPAPPRPALDDATASDFTTRLNTYRAQLGSGFSYDAASGDYLVTNPSGSRLDDFRARTPGSLTKRGAGTVASYQPLRFDHGVTVEGGSLEVWNSLHGNVHIAPGGTLDLELNGLVIGDVDNEGVLDASSGYYVYYDGAIFGNYTQDADATLRVYLGLQRDAQPTPLLTVSGTAKLDGKLEILRHVYIPSASYLEWILLAHGGVSGTFDSWSSPSLTITGTLRYDARNVWLDMSRVALATTAQGLPNASALTVASAAHVDAALAQADHFAAAPDADQQRFLASAARLLWIGDGAQFNRALDSLSGTQQADALQGAGDALGLPALASALDRRGAAAGRAWLQSDGHARVGGIDRWVAPNLLGGMATHAASTADGNDVAHLAYLRWLGNDGGYAGVTLGHAQRTAQIGRVIDFGDAGRWPVQSRRRFDTTRLEAEWGRRWQGTHAWATPFLGLGAQLVRGQHATELGQSGFELTLRDAAQRRADAAAGLRLGADWRFANGWIGLQAEAGRRSVLWQDGSQEAAFVGVPGTWFALPGDASRARHWHRIGLQGGFGRGWRWSAGHRGDERSAWWVGLQRAW